MKNLNAHHTECLIVGAGISGLLAATTLQSSGMQVKVLEKSRGVGGRMATRRIDHYRFDHGAQLIKQRSEIFSNLLHAWIADGLLEECNAGAFFQCGQTIDDGPAFCSPGGITAVPQRLAKALDIDLHCRVKSLIFEHDTWHVATDAGDLYNTKALLLTPPVPQVLEIVGGNERILRLSGIEKLARVEYEPCIAMMVVTDDPSAGFRDLIAPRDSVVMKIIDNYTKGVSPVPGTLTVHATPDFSREHFECSDEFLTGLLLSELKFLIREKPLLTRIHRWLYSQVVTGFAESHLLFDDPAPLGLAGDAFGTGGVEGAALSGMSLADALLKLMHE